MPVVGLFPRWVSYSLPDALWCYACISLIAIYWRGGPFIFKVLWLGVAIALSLGFEAGQFLNIVPGTFCPGDLGFSIAAIALALSHEALGKIHFKTGLGSTVNAGSSRPSSWV
jgi:hypothetical protein